MHSRPCINKLDRLRDCIQVGYPGDYSTCRCMAAYDPRLKEQPCCFLDVTRLFKPPSLQMLTPLFHAELLSNIRSITASIHLPSPSNPSTKLTLLSSSKLQLHHDGEITTLDLPANVTLSATTHLQKSMIMPGETNLSYRLPVEPKSCLESPTTLAVSENYVPWSAVSLSSSTKEVSLRCKSCSWELIPGEKINTWKDMPSGNWADMMDFWHCHKPETESEQTDSGDRYTGLQGGYAAMEGTALVELTYFLVAKGDCGSAIEMEVIQFDSPFHSQIFTPCISSARVGKKKVTSHRKVLMAICTDTIAQN